MPKERSHWLLARRVAGRLVTGPLADAILGYPDLVYAGAVAQDSAYYALDVPGAQAAADRLHGASGHDSFEPFRALATHRKSLGAQGLAFGLGALTHLAADVTFHPMVYSWTGGAEAREPELKVGWVYRHQACETALDLHFEALWGRAPFRTFAAVVRAGGRDLIPVFRAFAGEDPRPWVDAHRRLQRLFGNAFAAWVSRVVSRDRRRGPGDWSAAFYRGGPSLHPAFEGEMGWVDPVTAVPTKATLDELVVRYETLALALAAEWERAWTTGAEPFAGQTGLALDTGIRCDRDQTQQFFSPRWF